MKLVLNPRVLVTILVAIATANAASPVDGGGRTAMDLSGPGWRMWVDEKVKWNDDTLFLPLGAVIPKAGVERGSGAGYPRAELGKLPVNSPTGGWEELDDKTGLAVEVPGSVEQYLGADTKGDFHEIRGVSWWWRNITIPKAEGERRLLLYVGSVHTRAEVFLDDNLVGYNLVESTPFEVDLTPFAKPGQSCRLAIRVTNPGGNFAWEDWGAIGWGKYRIPSPSRGFGGVLDKVVLTQTDAVSIADLYVQNKTTIKDIDAVVTVANATGRPVTGEVIVRVVEKKDRSKEIARAEVKGQTFGVGETVVRVNVAAPDAKAWDVENPNLYVCEAALAAEKSADQVEKTFGFRWFAVEGIGKEALFRLNGKKIVLRSAISWGFWPVTGIIPTPELAEKQIRTAKALGLNMLNFHRSIGYPVVLDKADELGLLYYEEPGGYFCGSGDAFTFALAREKLLRMIRRDRSHPSLIIYNMINEGPAKAEPYQIQDMREAHAMDPTRAITYTSSGGRPPFMIPGDEKVYETGWIDQHNAYGPGCYRDGFYGGPKNIHRGGGDPKEIIFWGEEAAISTPARVELISQEASKLANKGWDGARYTRNYNEIADYIERKNLRGFFPSIDGLTMSMGNVAHYYQGRVIENVRIGNVVDGYVVNGWESELFENYSGIVDLYRNPKGDPAIMAWYNQPLYIAVKARGVVYGLPDEAKVDFWIVNEVDLKGAHTLKVAARDSRGKEVFAGEFPVEVAGGETYGQLLKEAVSIPLREAAGQYTITAELLDAEKKVKTTGHEEVYTVEWKTAKVPEGGVVLEGRDAIRKFLADEKGIEVADTLHPGDKPKWVLVAFGGDKRPGDEVPASVLTPPEGKDHGLRGEYFSGRELDKLVATRVDRKITFSWSPWGNKPDPALSKCVDFSVRWQGKVLPPASGVYTFHVSYNDGARLWIDGKQLFDDWTEAPNRNLRTKSGKVSLEAGKAVDIKLEYLQAKETADVYLMWTTPANTTAEVLRLVKEEGTTAIVLGETDKWAKALAEAGVVKFGGVFDVGEDWAGGQFFVRGHPLFKDLPLNQALNWPYQDLLKKGGRKTGLRLEGEEVVVGCLSRLDAPATAVAVIPYGKGRVVLSTLDIYGAMSHPEGKAVNVVKKLLCNYLEFAAPQVADVPASGK